MTNASGGNTADGISTQETYKRLFGGADALSKELSFEKAAYDGVERLRQLPGQDKTKPLFLQRNYAIRGVPSFSYNKYYDMYIADAPNSHGYKQEIELPLKDWLKDFCYASLLKENPHLICPLDNNRFVQSASEKLKESATGFRMLLRNYNCYNANALDNMGKVPVLYAAAYNALDTPTETDRLLEERATGFVNDFFLRVNDIRKAREQTGPAAKRARTATGTPAPASAGRG